MRKRKVRGNALPEVFTVTSLLKSPVVVGTPEISPLTESMLKPVGKPVAWYDVAV